MYPFGHHSATKTFVLWNVLIVLFPITNSPVSLLVLLYSTFVKLISNPTDKTHIRLIYINFLCNMFSFQVSYLIPSFIFL